MEEIRKLKKQLKLLKVSDEFIVETILNHVTSDDLKERKS